MCDSSVERYALLAVCLALLAGTLFGSKSAAAATLVDDEKLEIEVGALARAVGGVTYGAGVGTSYGTAVQFARLKASGDYRDRVRFSVQVGGGSGTVVLKDAWAELTAIDPFAVRLGRFKMPVSRERLISAGSLPFVSRALLSGFVPSRRVGAEVYGRFDAGGIEIRPEVGLFQPSPSPFGIAPVRGPGGQLLMGRVLASTEFGLDVHLGYSGLILERDASNRIVEYDDPFDLAVTYDANRWDLHLEGVTILDPPDSYGVFAGYLHAGYRFGPEGAINWKPMFAYDFVARRDHTHRWTAGINCKFWDTPFEAILDFRYRTTTDRTPDGSDPAGDRASVLAAFSGSF